MAKIKVLYVEDEPFLAKIVTETLQTRDFIVQHEGDGREVLEHCRSFEPDICILDVMLPYKDGFTLGRELRQHYAHIPILYLTSKVQTADILQGFASGGNDYLKKPFSIEELIVRIKNLVNLSSALPDEASPKSQNKLALGEYLFNPQKHELQFGETVRKLSYREVQLLQAFAKKQNKTLDRRLLLKEVWGDDSLANSRNLDVYITKLRSYLKGDPTVQIITLKGVGYHFVVG